MGENDSATIRGDNKCRPVLGDVTNQVGNQGFPFVTRGSWSKILSGNKRAAEDGIDDLRSTKQVCVVLEKDRCPIAKCTNKVVPNKVGLSPLRGGKTYRLKTGSGDVGSVDGRVGFDVKEPSCLALDSIILGEDQRVTSVVDVNDGSKDQHVASVVNVNDESKDQHVASVVDVNDGSKEGMVSGTCCEEKCVEDGNVCRGEESRGVSDVGESDFSLEEVATQVLSDNGKGAVGDCVTCSWSDSVETLRFAESQEMRSFGLERCTLVKGEGSNSFPGGMDPLKNCSCSFCTKAAYIWSDLQCQDVKGRISTLAKSRKEASNLVQKYSKETSTSEAQGNSSTGPPLETDLKTLWKSLFLHMDNVYAAESIQLQSNFAVLKDVREDYKMNLEMINIKPPDMQQCSSDDMIN